ncbi:MAG: hypothetical protein V1492_05865 [Candidatus Micrarchaeota archaeon]
MELKRNVRCSGCGNEVSFIFSGNLDVQQMTAVGKCPTCGLLLQIDFAVVEKTPVAPPAPAVVSSESVASAIPNLDEALSFDVDNNTLKNIME